MKQKLKATLAALLLIFGLGAALSAQPLSSQVLQLLARVNTWTARQVFQDLRLPASAPADTTERLYNVAGDLYFDGGLVSAGGGGGSNHALLSTTHTDVTASSPVRGGVITAQAGPVWAQLALGTAGQVLRSNGTDVVWSTDGSALTALNASNLASGTVPLARISNLANANVDAAAAIAWSKIDKAGSSLADLATRSAADLSSGTLPDARLSANVSLFGTSVQTAEILDGTILFADWASNGCVSGNFPQYDGANWICATVTPGSGTVTSVALAMPAIFSVTGSPVVGSGTLTANLATQTANTVWAGPTSGGAASPTFRALGYTDLPTSGVGAGTYVKLTVNAQGIATVGAAQIALATDVSGTLPLANGGTGLNAAADDTTLVSSGAAWVASVLPNCANGLTYTTASNTFGCSSSVGTHALLSASHSDTLAGTVQQGDLIYGSGVSQWTRLVIGSANRVMTSSGTTPVWSDRLDMGSVGGETVALDTTPAGDYVLEAGSLFAGRTAAAGAQPAVRILATATPSVGALGRGLQIVPSFVEAGSGTHSAIYGVSIDGLSVTPGGAATTEAATLYIGNAPNIGASNYSLVVDNGLARFDSGLIEYGRPVAQGQWTGATFAGGDYTGNGSMTWTVDVGDVSVHQVAITGKTVHFSVYLNATTVGGTPNSQLQVALTQSTGSFTFAAGCAGAFIYLDNGVAGTGVWVASAGTATLTLFKTMAAASWTASTDNTAVAVHGTCGIN